MPLPGIQALERLTPSLAAELTTCALRVAYRADPTWRRLQRPSPQSLLGTIAHDLMALATAGALRCSDGEGAGSCVERAWAQRITTAYERLQAAYPHGPVPPPDRWPGYQLTRLRLMRRLLPMARPSLGEARHGEAGREPAAPPLCEVSLRGGTLKLEGRIDRVERAGGELTIVDIKTGASVADTISDRHRQQLLLYCVLWASVHGEWPTQAAIETLGGRRMSIHVEPREAEECAAAAAAELEAFNRRASEGADPKALATPGREQCRFCDYREACPVMLRAFDPAWDWPCPPLLGRVIGLAAGRAENVVVTVQPELPAVWGPGCVAVVSWPAARAPTIGARLCLTDLVRIGGVRMTWQTRVLEWPWDETAS
jgi:hypothetical protein